MKRDQKGLEGGLVGVSKIPYFSLMKTTLEERNAEIRKRLGDRDISILTLDIETDAHPNLSELLPADIPANKAKRTKQTSKAALNPIRGRILLICLQDTVGNIACFHDDQEARLLKKFWKALGDHPEKHVYVTFNGRAFDLGFLTTASLLNGVEVPPAFVGLGKWGNRSLCIVDPIEILAQGNTEWRASLDTICKRLGLEGKTGDFGHRFGELWKDPNQRSTLLNYARRDVEATREVADVLNLIPLVVHHFEKEQAVRIQGNRNPCLHAEPFILPVEFRAWPTNLPLSQAPGRRWDPLLVREGSERTPDKKNARMPDHKQIGGVGRGDS